MIIINEMNFGVIKLNWVKIEKYLNLIMIYD